MESCLLKTNGQTRGKDAYGKCYGKCSIIVIGWILNFNNFIEKDRTKFLTKLGEKKEDGMKWKSTVMKRLEKIWTYFSVNHEEKEQKKNVIAMEVK